jgi:hypothetical protein
LGIWDFFYLAPCPWVVSFLLAASSFLFISFLRFRFLLFSSQWARDYGQRLRCKREGSTRPSWVVRRSWWKWCGLVGCDRCRCKERCRSEYGGVRQWRQWHSDGEEELG